MSTEQSPSLYIPNGVQTQRASAHAFSGIFCKFSLNFTMICVLSTRATHSKRVSDLMYAKNTERCVLHALDTRQTRSLHTPSTCQGYLHIKLHNEVHRIHNHSTSHSPYKNSCQQRLHKFNFSSLLAIIMCLPISILCKWWLSSRRLWSHIIVVLLIVRCWNWPP